ncbi:MAG: hypothetical protein AAF664_00855 [Planctomycetota bacterium]
MLGPPTKVNDLSDTVRTIRNSPDGKLLFVGAKGFRLYSARTIRPIGNLIRSDKDVNDADFSSDGDSIAVVRSQSPVEIYQVKGLRRVARSEASANFWEVEFIPQSNDLIACGGLSAIYRINADDGSTIAKEDTPFGKVTGLVALPSGRQIVTCGIDEKRQAVVELRDAVTLKTIRSIQTFNESIDRMLITKSGKKLFMSTRSGLISQYDLSSMQFDRQWVLDQANVRDIRLFDGETKLFVGGWYRKLTVLDLQSGNTQTLPVPEGRGLTAINVLRNPERVLVAPGLPKTYRFGSWPINSSKPIESSPRTIPDHNASTPDQEANQREQAAKVRVVLFCPQGIRPPQDYQLGIDRLCDYTDQFMIDSIESWGIKPKTKTLFVRDDKHVVVNGVIGSKPSSAYTKASAHDEAITSAIKAFGLPAKKDLWWVLIYLGEPPIRFADFRGGMSPKFGGWSIANYDSRATELRPGMPIAGELGDSMALKGMVHELGHAFGLPHIGPRFEQRQGNTLMGPTNANYRRIKGQHEPHAYVSQASAAMLMLHPVFQEQPLDSRTTHNLTVTGIASQLDDTGSIQLAAKIRGDGNQKFAILADDRTGLPGPYWTKHYVSRINENSAAVFKIGKAGSGGLLRLWFVNSDGSISGEGKGQGVNSAIRLRYKNADGRLEVTRAAR